MNTTIRPLPLIKESRVDKIKAALKCIDTHPFDRKKQRDCILELYPGKTEKSVFRGMVIPSLRHLGFIIGHGGGLRVSANGRIIIDSENIGGDLRRRSLRAVICEVDNTKFGFIDILGEETPIMLTNFIEKVTPTLDAINDRRIRERVVSWLAILEQVELISNTGTKLNLNESNRKQAVYDLDTSNVNTEQFRLLLFDEYLKLGRNSAGIVDITDLRSSIASIILTKEHKIVTEGMFDNLLRSIPFATESYLISLGRPMGAEEKLFGYKGNHYRTISIQYLKGE